MAATILSGGRGWPSRLRPARSGRCRGRVSLAAVRDWREDSTGSLRFETHRRLDTILSLATDDDLLRFDLALREVGDTR
jgi:hypothetical protein